MRILVVGATGTLGRPVVQALSLVHDVVAASRSGAVKVDIGDPTSIKAMYAELGVVDAVVCAAGDAAYGPLAELTDDDFERSLHGKLMGQVDLLRLGLDNVSDDGSITLTAGTLARYPEPGSSALSLVNSALEGFVRAAVAARVCVARAAQGPIDRVGSFSSFNKNSPGKSESRA